MSRVAEVQVQVGTVWTHYNGNNYRVIHIANDKSKDLDRYPIMVVYQGANGNVWTKNLTNWFRAMTPPPLGTLEALKPKPFQFLIGQRVIFLDSMIVTIESFPDVDGLVDIFSGGTEQVHRKIAVQTLKPLPNSQY